MTSKRRLYVWAPDYILGCAADASASYWYMGTFGEWGTVSRCGHYLPHHLTRWATCGYDWSAADKSGWVLWRWQAKRNVERTIRRRAALADV